MKGGKKTMSKVSDRRRHISFKNNERDEELLRWLDNRAKIFGVSAYIKVLIENDMKEYKYKEDK